MSESVNITGLVTVIQEEQTFGSGFTKQSFVVQVGDKYPQDLCIDAVKGARRDDCAKVAALNVGDVVSVEVNLRGREYNGKYYTSLQMWKLEVTTPATATAPVVDDPALEEIPF